MKSEFKPPKEVSRASRKLWQELYENYEPWDEAAIRLLNQLCNVNDLILDCEKKVKKDGLAITDRFGQMVAHPLLRVLKENRTQFARVIKLLGLLDQPPSDKKIGRPGY